MSITANSMADVVAFVIQSLGFTPESSVVLTLTNGKRTVCTLRVDAQPGPVPQTWAARVGGYLAEVPGADGALVVSFENDKALTRTQYRALGDVLAQAGTPLRGALLVTGGNIMDYDGDSTDSVPFMDAASSLVALEMLLAQDAPALLAANVPHPATDQTGRIAEHAANAALLDAEDAETRAVGRGTLSDLVDGYRAHGTVTADHAAWLAGTLMHCGLRDMLATSLSTREDGEDAMRDALLGNKAPESWEHLRTGARALFAALAHIPVPCRAEVLTIIGWTRWIDGMATEAYRFCQLAQQADPGHTLSTQGTKAPVRWVAVRHGLSSNGNDHVHLAVNLVREDGTRAGIQHDYQRSQDIALDLEKLFGLKEKQGKEHGLATRGYHPAEREAQARSKARARYELGLKRGDVTVPWKLVPKAEREALVAGAMGADQPRFELARTVRGCSTAAVDEAEFVRRLRRAGLILRPRLADGTRDVVAGYSVAKRPEFGEQPIWYGGGQLGRDLTLPRLRQVWPDTPTGASDAAAEWTAAKRHRRAVNPGREIHQPAPELWEQYGKDLDRLAAKLRSIDPSDRDTWAQVARRTAGAFAARSNQVEPAPGPIARASDNLARSAQTLRRDVDPKPRSMASIGNVAMLLASVAHGGQGPVAQMALLRQLAELARQLHHAHQQRNQTQCAQELASMSRHELNQIRDGLQGLVATGAAARDAALRGTTAPRLQGSPMPNQLNPDRRPVHIHEPDDGIER